MLHITGEDLQAMAMEKREADKHSEVALQQSYSALMDDTDCFSLQTQEAGTHFVYQWAMTFPEAVHLEQLWAIPSVRFCFIDKAAKGFAIHTREVAERTLFEGQYHLFFSKEECYSKETFAADSPYSLRSVAVSGAQFEAMALRYPEVFSVHFERYDTGENFFLPLQHSPAKAAILRELVGQLQCAPALGVAAKAYADAKLLELFLQLFTVESAVPAYKYCKRAADRECMGEVVRLITADLLHTPSIAELARAVGLNEKKLCYGFKELYGTTVYGYLFEHKMQLARRLLTTTDRSVKEIAWECGYDDPSHFSVAFKRRWRETASGVRGQ